MTYNAKAGRHDDMISAAAVAAGRLSDGAVGWGPPSEQLAAMVLGMSGSHAGPAPWAIGLDLGKVHDPTAIVIMRRVSVDRPGLPHRDMEPMVLVPEIPRNKTNCRDARPSEARYAGSPRRRHRRRDRPHQRPFVHTDVCRRQRRVG
jgi:hypothetical protein